MTRNIGINMVYTIIVSIILNVAVFFIGQVFGVSFQADIPGGTVVVLAVVILSLIGAVIGCLGYWLLGLLLSQERQRLWFIWLATIVGIVSMIGPWNASGDLPTMGFLGLMHVVSVLVMTWYLGVWTPRYVTPPSFAPSN